MSLSYINRLLRKVEMEIPPKTAVFCFVSWDILCVRAFSSTVFSYLFNARCSSLFIWQVNVLDCGLYLGNAAQNLLAELTDVISSDCRLMLSFRRSIILLTSMLYIFL